MHRLTGKQKRELIEAARIYHPCDCGVHVCGSDDTCNAAVTIANIPARSPDVARTVWEACRVEAGLPDDEECDLVVDLNIDRDNLHVADFGIRRQMLDRCLAAGRTALETKEGETDA